MALSLRKSGASLGAVLAFALGNPTLNIAVLVWLVFALGWQWAALRLVFGALLVVAVVALADQIRLPTSAPGIVEAPIDSTVAERPWPIRWVQSLLRFTVQLVPLMVVLVLLMGGAQVWLFPAVDPSWGSSWFTVVGLAVAGTLFAIPTGAEIPIIATMMGFGLGAGPAGALLLTLAPTNLASLAMMAHVLPIRIVGLTAGVTAAVGIAAGIVAATLAL